MPDPAINTPEYSVGELAHALKRTVEAAYGYVRVRGEISGYKRAASGHVYLCLKDDAAVIDGVMWKATAGALQFRPEDGLEVIVTGKLTTYPGRSKYQIVIERMEPAGVGALLAQLEERKRRLAAEGLFDASRKRPLPYIPQVIGIITSPTGAVIRDILHRLADRFPRRVIVWPVVVQGDAAAGQVVAALAGFNALVAGGKVPRPDLLIVARGGGSIEDLAAFNEEAVVRAVAASTIPVITAVGHETDTTLVDFASDHRAPTPTAAAERAVPVLSELVYGLGALGLRQDRAVRRGIEVRTERATASAKRLPSPRALLGLQQQRFDELADRLPRALKVGADRWRGRFEACSAALRPALLGRRVIASRGGLDKASAAMSASLRGLVAKDATKLAQTATALRPGLLVRHVSASRRDLDKVGVAMSASLRGLVARDATKLARTAALLRPAALTGANDRARARLTQASRLLDSFDPEGEIRRAQARGLVRVTDAEGRLVTSAAAAQAQHVLTLGFRDGDVPVSTALPRQGRLL
ncbi:exodeoxyribonuclease VII large subunit [Glacieibacterium sp.]|uniref:exodeoxyribonuclease VII large subunit n=1 Tax=Glacieibacterium sp. TaxID=2860237 RepID=UPI003B003E77